MLYESTKHGANESSRHHPQKWQMHFRIFPWVVLKLSVKGLLRYSVKCFGWKTSAVARSSSCFKLRKSSRWSSSFTKFPTGFQIPAASNEQFVFQLSCRKGAGFHGQQFGRFSLNLIIEILLFSVFYGLKPNIEALVFP